MNRIDSPRDIAIICDGARCMVTAVDSCGGIGEKACDVLHSPTEKAGLYTARVALLEVMATGASPVMATIAVCNEPKTAERLLEGIMLAFAGFSSLNWVISTEKNMPTCMTALGVSVTGICDEEMLRIGKSRSGDLLYLAGLPLVGPEVLAAGDDIFKLEHMLDLLLDRLVGSILPVGSRGIAAEADVLARESGLKAVLDAACGVDFQKSAGPSSCVIFSARPAFKDNTTLPLRMIGRLE